VLKVDGIPFGISKLSIWNRTRVGIASASMEFPFHMEFHLDSMELPRQA
jgi:hypothetical protein